MQNDYLDRVEKAMEEQTTNSWLALRYVNTKLDNLDYTDAIMAFAKWLDDGGDKEEVLIPF